MFEERLAPVVHRPSDQLPDRLAFGSPEAVLEKMIAFRDAGAQWMFVWPLVDDIEQLQRFSEAVIAPLRA